MSEVKTELEKRAAASLGDLATPVDDKKAEVKELVDEPKEDATEPVVEEDAETLEEDLEDTEVIEVSKKEEDKAKPKKKGGFQKKIGRLEQEKEYWRQEALRAQGSKAADKVETPKDISFRPKASDFANHDDYVEALVDWKAEQKITAIQAKRQQEEVKAQVQTKFQAHSARVDSFKEDHEDFDDALENVSTIPMSMAVQESILESDYGPEMMYALANDPKEFKRICSLPPLKAAKEMGKLESKFLKTESPKPQEKKTTSAPKPVTPVRARGAAVVKSLNDKDITYDEFKRLRQEQIKQNSMRR